MVFACTVPRDVVVVVRCTIKNNEFQYSFLLIISNYLYLSAYFHKLTTIIIRAILLLMFLLFL